MLPEQSVAWELRKSWATLVDVRLTLQPGCLLRTIVGKVEAVAATGAFVVVDGWHIPCVFVDAIGKPTHTDRDAYAKEMRSERIRRALNPATEAMAA